MLSNEYIAEAIIEVVNTGFDDLSILRSDIVSILQRMR